MLHITPHIRLTQYSELQLDLCRTEQIDDLAADLEEQYLIRKISRV